MKHGATIFVILFSICVHAQKIEHFYDYNWELCDVKKATYYSIIEKKDTVYHRQDYFIHGKSLQMDGYYKDTGCTIAHGPFNYYYGNRLLQSKGVYVNNKKNGVWLSFHYNGMMSDSVNYENGVVTGVRMGWHSNGYMSDSSNWKSDGSGVEITWFDNGNLSSAGLYEKGQKTGKWKYFHKNGNLSAIELYSNGVLTSKTYYDENGTMLTDTTTKDRKAMFIGGRDAWRKYLEKNLYFPDQWRFTKDAEVVVLVTCAIDEEGNVTDAYVSMPFQSDFDAIALKVVKASPKWQPAISHNRKVKYYVSQPVTFAQVSD